jgi:hypothetical protein
VPARIGRALFDQQLRVRVSIPAVLADEAVAAWERDSSGATLPKETAEQHAIRKRGAALGLIGLTVETSGVRQGDQVLIDLDAWHIGARSMQPRRMGFSTGFCRQVPDAPEGYACRIGVSWGDTRTALSGR